MARRASSKTGLLVTALSLLSLLRFAVPAYPQTAEQAILLTHRDRIPDFGASPTIASVASGPWSDPLTWSAGRIPATGDVVDISTGTTVVYDVVSGARIATVEVEAGGMLRFRTDAATKLVVANLLVLEGGALEVGTNAEPVAADLTATIVFANQPLDTATDPRQYGNGLIALGKVTMHGQVKAPTFARLAVEPTAGDVSLTLEEAVAGWKPGDRLFLPDSRQLQWNERGTSYVPRWEYVNIADVSVDGRILSLSSPLQ
ncbi:MAG: G8 domain-containing protein, partial [Candidatus Binatia bacterium]